MGNAIRGAVTEAVNELRWCVIPLSPPCIIARRGGCVLKKMLRSHRTDAAGVVFLCVLNRKTTPASRSAEASRHLFNRSATPPCGDARRGIRSIPIRSHVYGPALQLDRAEILSWPLSLAS